MILRHAYDPDGLYDIDPAEESHAAALHDQDTLDAIAARDEREMVRLVSENTHMANTIAQIDEMVAEVESGEDDGSDLADRIRAALGGNDE